MTEDKNLLFLANPVGDLNRLISLARARGAGRLLILVGATPVCRIGTELSSPLDPQVVHFSQTQALADAILSGEQAVELDKEGAVEVDYAAEGLTYRINVFFGDGSHNFVVYF